jgi:hypothetical protein
MNSSITSGPNVSTADAFRASLLKAKRFALREKAHGLTARASLLKANRFELREKAHGLTARHRRLMREAICNQVRRAERTLDRNHVRQCAEIRARFKLHGETPLEIQARLIKAGLIPDVRVKR